MVDVFNFLKTGQGMFVVIQRNFNIVIDLLLPVTCLAIKGEAQAEGNE